MSDKLTALERYVLRRQLHVARAVTAALLVDLIEDLELLDVDLPQFFDHLGAASRVAWQEAYRSGHDGSGLRRL